MTLAGVEKTVAWAVGLGLAITGPLTAATSILPKGVGAVMTVVGGVLVGVERYLTTSSSDKAAARAVQKVALGFPPAATKELK